MWRILDSKIGLAVEIGSVFFLIMLHIWLLCDLLPVFWLVPTVVIILSWIFRKPKTVKMAGQKKIDWVLEDLGLLPRTGAYVGRLILITVCALGIVVILGLIFNPEFLDNKKLKYIAHWLGGYFLWALIQQLTYQGYFIDRLDMMFSKSAWKTKHWLVSLVGGAMFSAVHAPNLFLMVVTFVGGVISAKFFLTNRFLYVIAPLHAIVAVAVVICLPESWHHNLRIGPYFLEKLNW